MVSYACTFKPLLLFYMTNTAVSGMFPQLPYTINQDLSTDFKLISQFLIGPSNVHKGRVLLHCIPFTVNCATEPCNGNRCYTYFNLLCRFTNRNLANTNFFLTRETVEYFLTYIFHFNFPLPC